MLTKNSKIDVPADDPFVNDQLERKVIVENLTYLVQSTNQPFVISIEAPWGWGKTTFIEMWKAHLENQGHTCLYFNAWENDFVEDPMIAFIGEIGKAIGEKDAKGKLGKRLNKLQDVGGKILRRTLPFAVQLATQGLLSQENVKTASDFLFESSDEIAKFWSDIATERIKAYESDKQGIEEFRKELGEFAKEIAEGEENKPPLVFFVDELDRCRPDFSIALLERIKHIFNAEGIVFVLGIDREQIEQSVKSIYGQEMDSDGYLRRFLDVSFRLPTPTVEKFCKFLFERFSLGEVFENRRNGRNEQDTLINTFVSLSVTYGFSLRVIEQCFTELNVLLRTTPASKIRPYLPAFLVAFRTYKPEVYSRLRSEFSFQEMKELINVIREDLDINIRSYFWLLAQIEAHLIHDILKEPERSKALEEMKAVAASETDPYREYAKRVMVNVEHLDFEVYGVLGHLVTSLDLLGSLT